MSRGGANKHEGRVAIGVPFHADSLDRPSRKGSGTDQIEATETGKTALGGENAILGVSARLGG